METSEDIELLISLEENLCRSELNAIQQSQFIVKREELLVKLGRKAVVGSNQYTDDLITNTELAKAKLLGKIAHDSQTISQRGERKAHLLGLMINEDYDSRNTKIIEYSITQILEH